MRPCWNHRSFDAAHAIAANTGRNKYSRNTSGVSDSKLACFGKQAQRRMQVDARSQEHAKQEQQRAGERGRRVLHPGRGSDVTAVPRRPALDLSTGKQPVPRTTASNPRDRQQHPGRTADNAEQEPRVLHTRRRDVAELAGSNVRSATERYTDGQSGAVRATQQARPRQDEHRRPHRRADLVAASAPDHCAAHPGTRSQRPW